MGKLEDALKSLIKSEYGGVPKFAEQANLPPTTVYNALDRGMANTRTETTDKIYRTLNIDLETASLTDFRKLRIKDGNQNDFVDVPLYGSIAAGTPIEMIAVDDYHPIPAPMHDRYPNAFLLKVSGESMNHILPNGSFALIDPREEIVKDNDPYAVCINGFDATIKRVKRLENGFQLVPDSTDPTFPVQTFNYNEPGTDEITVIGKVVWHVIPFDWAY